MWERRVICFDGFGQCRRCCQVFIEVTSVQPVARLSHDRADRFTIKLRFCEAFLELPHWKWPIVLTHLKATDFEVVAWFSILDASTEVPFLLVADVESRVNVIDVKCQILNQSPLTLGPVAHFCLYR